MWLKLASFILRNRVVILVILGIATAFMGYQATKVKMVYKFGGLLPETDSTYIIYEDFIEKFSEDGNVLVLGVNDPQLLEVENFQSWYDLGQNIKGVTVPKDTMINDEMVTLSKNVVDSVFSVAHCYTIVKNEEEKRFRFQKIQKGRPTSQAEVDSVITQVYSLPFYDGLLYKDSSDATLMMVFVNAGLFNSQDRGQGVEQITDIVDEFTADSGIECHISGLPFIRTEMTNKVKDELRFFILLAAAMTGLLLFFFFRNIGVVAVCLLVVGIGVVWSMGTIGMLGYRISMLMGLIPPLMIVIGVPNCVYLMNKYHGEYKKHGNKAKALTRVVQKIGNATFMTNMTTAMGFATFMFTHSDIMRHFGVVAAINIIAIFVISIVTIPIVTSFMPAPRRKHVKHLDRKWLYFMVNKFVKIVQDYRRPVYIGVALVMLVSIYGMTRVKTTGNIVGDFPVNDRVIHDLTWFEDNFNGVMPFEMVVDCKRPGQIMKPNNLQKLEKLQRKLEAHPEFSRSLSIVDATKFARQAFYNGSESRYGLIKRNEQSFIGPYFQSDYNTGGMESTFLDSARSITRISAQIADIGTEEMEALLANLRVEVEEIFPPDKYEVTMTGTSIVFLEGTEYMVKNLIISLAIAIFVICVIMSVLFRSVRMVLISLLPNLIPLLFTAAVMGYFGIPLKPSTILVFSIAFGISVDDTIHFLAKYRQELKVLRWNIKESVLLAVKETGVSMMYTSIVLFFGFGIFGASEFGGVRALGILVSLTLMVAMFANLVVLPSLLLSFEKSITTKAFSEPFLEIIDEEEDIELHELQVKKNT